MSDEQLRVNALIARSRRLQEVEGLPQAATGLSQTASALRARIDQQLQGQRPNIWHSAAAVSSLVVRFLAAGVLGLPADAVERCAPGALRGFSLPRASARTKVARGRRVVLAGGAPSVKFAQFLASAHGLVPQSWISTFAWATDAASPLAIEDVCAALGRELGPAASQIVWLDPIPLGSGSIGQVHAACLSDGRDVVVKVRKPGITREFDRDLPAAVMAARIAALLFPRTAAVGLPALVRLFSQLTREELDFRIEAANQVEAVAILDELGVTHVCAPLPIPGLVTSGALVMTPAHGVGYHRATQAHLDRGSEVLQASVQAVVQSAMTYGVFHGDLHGGNVLIRDDGMVSLVDFGVVGRLTDEQRTGLMQFLAAFAAGSATAMINALRVAQPGNARLSHVEGRLQQQLDLNAGRAGGAITYEQLAGSLTGVVETLIRLRVVITPAWLLFFRNLIYLTGFAKRVAPTEDLLDQVNLAIRTALAS